MYSWFVVILLAAAHLAAFADRTLLGLLAQPLKLSLGLSDVQLGLLQGPAFVALYVVAMLPFGRLADGTRRLPIVLGSVLTWSVGTAACGLAPGFGSLALGRVGVGLGQAGFTPAALSLISAHLVRGRLGLGIALFTAGATIGRSVAFLLGGAGLHLLIATGGLDLPGGPHLAPWQGVFVLAALPNLVILALQAGTIREPGRPVASAGPGYRLAAAWLVRRWRRYLPHTVAAASAGLLVQTVTSWAPTFYLRQYGIPLTTSAPALGLIILVAAPLGHLVGGALLDRLRRAVGGRAPAILLLASSMLTLPAALLLCLAGHAVASFAGYGLATALLGIASPAALGGLQYMTPSRLRGRITALFICCVTAIGTGLGPLAVGAMNDHVFGESGLGLSLLSVFALCALIGGGAAFIRLCDAWPLRGMRAPG